MASLVINIDDAKATRVINALSAAFGYEEFVETVPGSPLVPNPETRAQFARRMVVERIKQTVLNYEATVADTSYRNTQEDPGVS